MITGWGRNLTIALLLLNQNSWANEIYIEQSGDNVVITIEQSGEKNTITAPTGSPFTESHIHGDGNSLLIKQKNTGQANSGGTVGFDVFGDYNSIELGQGYTGAGLVGTDTTESGAKSIDLVISGDSNNVHIGQRNGSSGTYNGHIATVDITGNSNSVDAEQTNDGIKSVDIDLSGNGHSVISRQMNEGAHTSTINLSNGGGAYSLNVTQNSLTAQTYSLTGTCAIASGCAVSVTQN